MNVIRKNGSSVPALEEVGKIPFFRFPLFSETGLVEHGFSTRIGGISSGYCETLNVTFATGDDPEAVRENYRRIGRAFGADPGNMIYGDQKHGVNVRRVTFADAGKGIFREKDYENVDSLITDEPGLVLCIGTADCVPILFLDPVHRAIGAAHSGWRGTVGRIGRETVLAMHREFESRPEELLACIGPCICSDCYEVGPEVALEFSREFCGSEEPAEHPLLKKNAVGKYQLDLWEANRRVLCEAGILPEHLEMTNVCTCCNPKMLFSHRRTGFQRGNQGGFLMLRKEQGS